MKDEWKEEERTIKVYKNSCHYYIYRILEYGGSWIVIYGDDEFENIECFASLEDAKKWCSELSKYTEACFNEYDAYEGMNNQEE